MVGRKTGIGQKGWSKQGEDGMTRENKIHFKWRLGKNRKRVVCRHDRAGRSEGGWPGLFFLFVFGCFVLFCFSNRTYAQKNRLHVSEAEGWKKFGAWYLTGNETDNRKIIWRNLGKNYKGKPGAVVVARCDSDGYAEIWADTTGVHFFDQSTNKVNTPIDLTSLGLKYGPGVNYEFHSDFSLSYFYVQWGKVKIEVGKDKKVGGISGNALLDIHGNILWKKTKILSSKDKSFIAAVSISPNGSLLVGKSTAPDEIESLELWDRSGNKVQEIPGTPEKFSWSDDGREIHYKWKKRNRTSTGWKFESKTTDYDEEGTYLRGDK